MTIKPTPTKPVKNAAVPKSVAPAKPSPTKLPARFSETGATAPAKLPAPSAVPISFSDILATRPKPTSASSARERILFAAVEILNDDGFAALTQTRVAEHAGLRQSHVTYYFPTRNHLLRETAAFGCNTWIDVMAEAIDAGMLTIETMREFIAPDIDDRRFARLMCALTVASDEDESIKPWLKTFEDANHARFLQSFQKLGLVIHESDLEVFHATLVGSLILDLGESSDESLSRARRVAFRAFDVLVASASPIKTSALRTKSKTQIPTAKSGVVKKVNPRKSSR